MQNSSEGVTPMLYQEHFVKKRLITQGRAGDPNLSL